MGRLWTDERRLAATTLLGLGVLVAAVCVGRPGESAWLPPCLFYKLTGLYCPGCGSTRMLYWLVHGHPLLAMRENALAMLVLPWVVWRLGVQMLASPRGRERWNWRWGMGFAGVLVAFMVARNVPAGPLCKLAPGGVCAVVGRPG
jgi:hypothetical protein